MSPFDFTWFKATWIVPVIRHCLPSSLDAATSQDACRLQIRDERIHPVLTSFPLSRELIPVSSPRINCVDDRLYHYRSLQSEQQQFDSIVHNHIRLQHKIYLASQAVRSIARSHVESNRAATGELQKSSPVVGWRVSIFITLILLISVTA